MVGPANGIAVLYIPPSLEEVSSSLEFCTKAYSVVKSIHPDLVSLIVSANPIYGLVVDEKLILTDVKVIHG